MTAPKVPNAVNGQSTPAVAPLAQQILDAQAASFQSRIKNLLGQFADAEGKAAQAITTALQELAQYEKTPDAPPASTRVQDILDGKAQLPTDPQQLHDLWRTLTSAEKDALWQHDQYLGNHDGIPAVDRDHYNRLKLQDEYYRAVVHDPSVDDNGKGDDLATVLSQVDKPDRYLLQLDTQSGSRTHAIIASGNPDTAGTVTTYVPGTGSRPSKIGGDMDRVEAMKSQAQYSGAKNPSVIAWLGYDAPEGLTNATQQHYADSATSSLDRFQDGLRVTHDGSPSHNTVIGHSYGSTLVGDAAAHGHTLNADSVMFVGSPGVTAMNASDLNLTGISHDDVANHIFASKAANDPIPFLYPEIGTGELPGLDDFGPDPADPAQGFGAKVFTSDPGSSHWYELGYGDHAHSEYWKAHSKSLIAIGDIIAGADNAAMGVK